VDDIKAHGVLMPIILEGDGCTIQDGHRRCQAAEHAGIDTVPAVVLSGDTDAAFLSAQLGRNLSTYAKCVLHRGRIEQLVAQGNAVKVKNATKQPTEADLELAEAHADAWMLVEEVLDTPRDTLRRGARLLARIEKLRAGSSKEKVKADKLETTFKDRGLWPALELDGEKKARIDSAHDGPRVWCGDGTDPRRRSATPQESPATDVQNGPPTSPDCSDWPGSGGDAPAPPIEDVHPATVAGGPEAYEYAAAIATAKSAPGWDHWDYDAGTVECEGVFTAEQLRAIAYLLDNRLLERAINDN
jgi:ParB-like chromosome segregation protein Spo0J